MDKQTDKRKGRSTPVEPAPDEVERIARRLARAGLCSRREAETWIAAGRVAVNGRVLSTPAVNVGSQDRIEVDGKPVAGKERTRLWLYHKPAGLVTTARDPQGRRTVFDALPESLPRVISVGRLDMSTEGLLLLTNDGGLARVLELPGTGWLRRYRVRAHGKVSQPQLDALAQGIAVDGVLYGPIEAAIDRVQGANVWLTVGLREGKNREVKNVLAALGLEVNRLIRVSFGPFQLGDLAVGEVRELRGRYLRDQLGERLIAQAGAQFDLGLRSERKAEPEPQPQRPSRKSTPGRPAPETPKRKPGQRGGKAVPRGGKDGRLDALEKLATKPRGGPKGGKPPKGRRGGRG